MRVHETATGYAESSWPDVTNWIGNSSMDDPLNWIEISDELQTDIWKILTDDCTIINPSVKLQVGR